MLKIRICKLSILFIFYAIISACSYHPVISQGNILEAKDISQLQLGMNKEQVAYLLGSPVLTDITNSNIWDFVYQERQNTTILIRQTLRLTFANNKLIKIDRAKQAPNYLPKK